MRSKSVRACRETTFRFGYRLVAAAMTSVTLLGAPAQADDAADYWMVQVSADHKVFDFIDASTITYDGPFRSVWITEIVAGKDIAKHQLRRKMTFALFDCARKSTRESRIVTYDKQGDVLTDRSRDRGEYQAIDPHGFASVELEFVCGNSDLWTSRKGWTEIDTTPEKKADNDLKAFQTNKTP
jgi:hypothetical protein